MLQCQSQQRGGETEVGHPAHGVPISQWQWLHLQKMQAHRLQIAMSQPGLGQEEMIPKYIIIFSLDRKYWRLVFIPEVDKVEQLSQLVALEMVLVKIIRVQRGSNINY